MCREVLRQARQRVRGGLVEEVTLRFVRLRDFEGHVHYVPNGEIKVVTNRTRGFAQAVIEVGIAYREDPDAAFAAMREVAEAMRAEPGWARRIAEPLEVIGVERWADSAVILRARLKVAPPLEQWNVRREYLRRLKKRFDVEGIEIPSPQLTVHAAADAHGGTAVSGLRQVPTRGDSSVQPGAP